MIFTPSIGFFGSSVAPTPPIGTTWQTDAYDYFLTSNWTTTTGDVNTGSVSGWSGQKAVMSTTRDSNSTVLTGAGSGRRTINTLAKNLRLTNYLTTGEVGILLAVKLNDTDFARIIYNAAISNGFYVWGSSNLLAMEQFGDRKRWSHDAWHPTTPPGDRYGWHALAIKYEANAAGVTQPKVWVDGVAATNFDGAGLNANMGGLYKLGDGAYTSWNLGDMAFFTNPSDANMLLYSSELAAKWRA